MVNLTPCPKEVAAPPTCPAPRVSPLGGEGALKDLAYTGHAGYHRRAPRGRVQRGSVPQGRRGFVLAVMNEQEHGIPQALLLCGASVVDSHAGPIKRTVRLTETVELWPKASRRCVLSPGFVRLSLDALSAGPTSSANAPAFDRASPRRAIRLVNRHDSAVRRFLPQPDRSPRCQLVNTLARGSRSQGAPVNQKRPLRPGG